MERPRPFRGKHSRQPEQSQYNPESVVNSLKRASEVIDDMMSALYAKDEEVGAQLARLGAAEETLRWIQVGIEDEVNFTGIKDAVIRLHVSHHQVREARKEALTTANIKARTKTLDVTDTLQAGAALFAEYPHDDVLPVAIGAMLAQRSTVEALQDLDKDLHLKLSKEKEVSELISVLRRGVTTLKLTKGDKTPLRFMEKYAVPLVTMIEGLNMTVGKYAIQNPNWRAAYDANEELRQLLAQLVYMTNPE